MLKIDFPWLYIQAKDGRTKITLQKLEKALGSIKGKTKVIVIKGYQKFPLRLGNFRIWLNPNNEIASLDIYTEIFRENHHAILPNFSGKDDEVIIDLGANEGFYTLKVKENSPKAKVIAVEPNPEAFKVLKRNVKLNNLKNVSLVNKAITSRDGKVRFEIEEGVTEIGGLKVVGKRKWLDKKMLKKIVVGSLTLESLCKKCKVNKIDLLKIDVEGAELEILKSSKNVLNNVKKVVVEYHSENLRRQIRKFMIKIGFVVVFEEKKACDDIYFVRSA
jgi:FkbM family methyltransferase